MGGPSRCHHIQGCDKTKPVTVIFANVNRERKVAPPTDERMSTPGT